MTTTDKAAGLVARLLRYAGWTGEDCDCGSCVQCRNTDTMREAAEALETQASLINEAIEAGAPALRELDCLAACICHADQREEVQAVADKFRATLAKLRGPSS